MKRSRTMEDFFAGKTKVGLSHRKFIFNEFTGKTIEIVNMGERAVKLHPALLGTASLDPWGFGGATPSRSRMFSGALDLPGNGARVGDMSHDHLINRALIHPTGRHSAISDEYSRRYRDVPTFKIKVDALCSSLNIENPDEHGQKLLGHLRDKPGQPTGQNWWDEYKVAELALRRAGVEQVIPFDSFCESDHDPQLGEQDYFRAWTSVESGVLCYNSISSGGIAAAQRRQIGPKDDRPKPQPRSYPVDKVYAALKHVNSIHPSVVQVVYDQDGRWDFQSAEGKTVTFTGGEDISILEPAMYQVEEAGRLHQVITLTEALEADGTE